MKTFFVSLAACLIVVGCGSSHQSESGNVFSKENPKPSKFSTTMKTTQSDKNNQPIPSSERIINIVYQFHPTEQGINWRRTMKIDYQHRIQSMFQEGVISEMDNQKMLLTVKRSSCDDAEGIRVAPSSDVVYYQASPSVLKLDTTPIPPPAKGFTDIMGQIIGGIMVDSMRMMLEQAFSFGSARTFLTSGHGSFQQDNDLQILSEDLGEVGCFNVFGRDFVASKLHPSNEF